MLHPTVNSPEQPARLMVAVIVVLALAAIAYGGWTDYGATIRQAESFTAQMVRAVEHHALRSLEFTDQMLVHLADAVPAAGLSDLDDRQREHIQGEMDVFLSGTGSGSAAWVVDEDGQVVASTKTSPAITAIAWRDTFVALRDGANFHIGLPDHGRITMARRIDGPEGHFAGAVLAAVSIEHLDALFSGLGVEEGAVAGLFHTENGRTLARYPWAPDADAHAQARSALFRGLLPTAQAGTYEIRLDGSNRAFSYRAVAGYPVVAVVGVSRAAVLKGWAERQTWAAAVAILLAGLVLILGTRVIAASRATSEANEKLGMALSDRNLLLAEVHHRVKNNLQIIQSLLTMESLTAPPESRSGYEDSLQRIQAMGMVHELLYQSGDFGSIRCKEYIRRLCELLIGEHPSVALSIEGDETDLDLDRAVPFAMAVNEIVVNALKHAFADGRAGLLAVRLTKGDGRVVVRVADDGPGLPAGFDPVRSRSLGTRLLRGLADQLGGEVSFANEGGTVVRLTFPLA